MKFRLFRRRLTISSPRMAVRNTWPWPVRCVLVTAVLGSFTGVALWVFGANSSAYGLDTGVKEELQTLRAEVSLLKADREKAQFIVNTSGSLLTTEKAAQEKMATQIRRLEADNRFLRDDLGFFEKLLPTSGAGGVAIRSLQAEMLSKSQLKWHVLVIQPAKGAPDFTGKFDMTINGTVAGKPWVVNLPGGAQHLQFKQYRRIEGVLDLPPQAVVQTVTAKVTEGAATRSAQTFKL